MPAIPSLAQLQDVPTLAKTVLQMLTGDVTGDPPLRVVRAATTANIADLTAVSTTLDGLTLVAGDRVLVKNQSTHSQNGIYVVGTVVSTTAPFTRATDMSNSADVQSGMLVGVSEGTTNANTVQQMTTAGWPGTKALGTDTLDFGAVTAAALTSTAAGDGSFGTAASAGVATTAARADHAHRIKQDTAGAALTNADVTIQVSGGRWRTLPAATLTGNHTVTLATTGATAGDVIEITRLDATANTYAIINGGAGAGTLVTMPASKVNFAKVAFDGTNWALVACGTQ